MGADRVKGAAKVTAAGVEVVFILPVLGEVHADEPAVAPGDSGLATHGPDFAAVNWFGTVYTFGGKQRAVVAALWQAKEMGHEWVSQDALLELAESECRRIRDLFRGHPAWGTMIVSAHTGGGPPGAYRLARHID